MNKSVLLGIALIVVAGLAYYQFSYAPAQKAAEEAAAVEAAEATKKAAEKAAKERQDARNRRK